MKKSSRQIVVALSEITQLGLSASISFLIWIYLAKKVKDFLNLGNWATVFGVILGAGSAMMVFVNFYRRVNKINSEKEDK